MDGLIQIANDEVDKVGVKEVHLLTLSKNDGLYYITNDFGRYKFTGKNYIKYNNGDTKEKSQFKNGKKHGKWFWYTKNGKRIKNEIWEEGTLISEKYL